MFYFIFLIIKSTCHHIHIHTFYHTFQYECASKKNILTNPTVFILASCLSIYQKKKGSNKPEWIFITKPNKYGQIQATAKRKPLARKENGNMNRFAYQAHTYTINMVSFPIFRQIKCAHHREMCTQHKYTHNTKKRVLYLQYICTGIVRNINP